MSDALVIRLGPTADIQYLLVDAAGGRLGSVLSGGLAQAAPLAANRRVIVLIPGTEVVYAEPELPAKSASRLAQLAPYALEEQLAADIDSMHFAVGKRADSGKTPVAAVLRERMAAWLAMLAAADIQPHEMYAESSVIPSGGSTLIVDGDLVYVRHPTTAGVVLDAQPFEAALQLALDSQLDSDGGEHILRDLQLYATQSDYQRNLETFEAFREKVPGLQVKLLPEGPLPIFAMEAATSNAVNLLYGPYERKSSISASLAPWRYAAVLLGIAALLHVGYNGIRIWQSIRAERDLDKQIRELVVQSIPGATLKDTRDARKQFETRLGILKQGGGRGDLVSSLTTLSEALAQSPDTRVEALSYRTQTIDLRVTAPSVDELDKIQQAATSAGLVTQIQSATPRDSKVEGRLQLKPGA